MRLLTTLLIWILLVLSFSQEEMLAQENGDPALDGQDFLPIVPMMPGQVVRFDHLTVEDGLMSDETNSIFQTSDGFVWIGTYEGMQRFDGYQFKDFYHDPDDPTSISMNIYYYFFEDSAGNFWIGTVDGLNLYDKASETFTRFYPDAENPDREFFNIFSISESSLGGLWIGTIAGLYHFHPETGQFLAFNHDPEDLTSLSDDFISSAFEDSRGELWVTTFGGGLNRLVTPLSTIQDSIETGDGVSLEFERFSLGDDEDSNNLGAAIEDSFGDIWIPTRNGLARLVADDDRIEIDFKFFRHNEDSPTSLSGDRVLSVLEDSEGYLWVATQQNGLNLFDRESEKFRNFRNDGREDGIRTDLIADIFEDAQGLLWISTGGNGISILDRRPLAFGYFREDADDSGSLNDSNVKAIWEGADGELWIGTYSGLNQLINDEPPYFIQYLHDEEDPTSLSSDQVSAIMKDSKGNIWVGTYDAGLNRLKAGEVQFEHFRHDENNPASLGSDRINSLAEDSLGNTWIITSSGLHRTGGGGIAEFEKIYDFESEQRSSVLIEDSEGNLWFGNREGLKKLSKSDLAKAAPQVIDYVFEGNDPDDSGISVRAIAEDKQGFLWIGTGDGIWKFDPQSGEYLARYDVEEPVPKGVGTYGVVIDEEGSIWAGADTIYKFDPQSESFTQYTDADGVLSGLVNNAYRGPSGRIYFGGFDGLNAFHPQNIVKEASAPPTVLTDFLLYNESVPVSEGGVLPQQVNTAEAIVLAHDDDIFAFDFSALSYRAPDQNQYAYMLEGFDNDWIYTDANNRRATYTNIPPGGYTFHVKGANEQGIWNEEPASINIVITPPWWQTWWFRGGILLLVVGLLYGVYRWRVRSVEKRNRELEEEVSQRTLELSESNEQLIVAREQAEAANQAKSTFLAHMSHELRTPLNGILGYAQVLKRNDDVTVPQRTGLKTIENNGEHLLALINDILDLSRVEAGETRLQYRRFHLPGLCSDAVELTRFRAEQKELAFVDEISPDLPVIVEGDDTRLRQVLINLLGNAVRYTNAGTITFRVHPADPLESEDSARSLASRVLFEVEDTGIGIPEDQIEMIFEPFRQVDGAPAPKGSAGLGLAISKGLVELMGGEIQVESTPGSGSRFWFELALNALDQQESRPASPLQSIVGFKDVDKKVLIVDDIEDNRAVLVSMLTPLGFELQEARDGLEALEKARAFEPDAIILDVAMPGMDGLEVTRHIRQDPDLKETVIIAHSASVYDEERQRALADGCDAFLSKPVRFERLFLVLETHLNLQPVFGDTETETGTEGEDDVLQLTLPPDEIATVMLEASKRGAIKEVERQISRLQDEGEEHRQTAVYLQILADEYDFEAINAYLQPIVDAKAES